jgi:hypothetical protein
MKQAATTKGTIEYGRNPLEQLPRRPYKVVYYMEQRNFHRLVNRFSTEESMRDFIKTKWGVEVAPEETP